TSGSLATRPKVWNVSRAIAARTRGELEPRVVKILPGASYNSGMPADYLPVLIFLIIASALAAVLLTLGTGLGRYFSRDPGDREKLSPYECGFEAFEDTRMRFDVRYYLVAILFIVFDLEIAFLFPWAVVLNDVGFAGFLSMMLFLAILTVGFIYEWMKGALEWE